ncbi:MAG: 60S ribosomal export protein NMD3 [Thermoplasmatota archaeon]
MGAKVFCVACGKESEPLSERGLCRECFAERTTVVRLPEHVDVEMCVHCGSRKIGEIWTPRGQGAPADDAQRARLAEEASADAAQIVRDIERPAVRAIAIQQDSRNYAVTVEVTGLVPPFPVKGSATTVARVKRATCLRCSRIQGGYFEGIVQLRATGRKLIPDEFVQARRTADRVVERIVDQGDRNAFVLKEEEQDGGLDIYMGTNNVGRVTAKAIAEAMGGKLTEHAKIVGVKDGLDLFRVTFSVKIPQYRSGDVVIVEDRPKIVQTIGTKTVTLRDAETMQIESVEREHFRPSRIIARSDAREAVVVTRRGSELDVLDPWTYATVTLRAPGPTEREPAAEPGTSVWVVRWDEGLVVVGRP